jgi:hypothetical protein
MQADVVSNEAINTTLVTSETDAQPDVVGNEAINTRFTEEEVEKGIKHLRTGKACGVDNILNELIKYSPPEMTELLTKLFNVILDTGITPTQWSIGMIIPIYKNKGSTKDPDNYRGITLLSCISKLFTALINSRLSEFLEENNMLGEEQAGFRKGYSTLDHILSLHLTIEYMLSRKKRVYCAFIDYKKAFDSVDRTSLWSKVLAHNINGKVLRVVKNMYAEAKSCIKHGNEVSELFNCDIGVRQGENLSPLLFSLFLNDLECFLRDRSSGIHIETEQSGLDGYIKLFTLLYADDTIIVSETEKGLQSSLDALYQYCLDWRLAVNTTKTKVVVFSKGKVRKTPAWKFGPDTIETQHNYTYLGVTFNYNGSFSLAISKQINQAKRGLYCLISKVRKIQLPLDIQSHLLDTCILPILLYGSEVWGFSDIKHVEVFHNQICKKLLCICKTTANCVALGELGRQNMEYHINQRILNFWARIASGKESKISTVLYRAFRSTYNTGLHKPKWLIHTHQLLNKLGLGFMWDEVHIDTTLFKCIVKQRMLDISNQNWKSTVYDSPMCSNYKLMKDDLKLEPYLYTLNQQDAIKLCKFRSGNHRLPVNTGRYHGLARQERICNLCPIQETGDEVHYLIRCTHFNRARDMYLDKKINALANNNLETGIRAMFNTKDKQQLQNLSKFVQIIMSQFSN